MGTRIITIDGPAGAGKTTVSKQLAKALRCIYVDTGALYRGVAYEIHRRKIDWENDTALEAFLKTLDLGFVLKNGNLVLMSSGKDITSFIRTPKISMLASATSARPQVRDALLDIQRNIGAANNAVFEGRDMGTVVFPNAAHKFFLFADLKVRARRRFDEMDDQNKDIDTVETLMGKRDKNDSTRVTAPLKPAKDAVNIDSSGLSVALVVKKMLESIENAP